MFHVKQSDEIQPINTAAVAGVLLATGISVSSSQCALLAQHANAVLRTNTIMNLTRIVEPEDVVRLHIVDSLAFTRTIAPLSGNVVDIGSGAGYPGIPLAILGLDVVLCESVKKKAAFLETCVAELGLRTTVSALRAEELAVRAPASANVVVARAVSSLASLVELAAPLLRTSGRLVALKGTPEPEERDRGLRAATECGMRLVQESKYTLPGGDRRTVLVYELVAQPRLALPRRPGMAQREPLG